MRLITSDTEVFKYNWIKSYSKTRKLIHIRSYAMITRYSKRVYQMAYKCKKGVI
nr:MAG TPA: hypothetical protein [Caudoviricetes sp.]